MQRYFAILLLLVVSFSCRKSTPDINFSSDTIELRHVERLLRDSMQAEEFKVVDLGDVSRLMQDDQAFTTYKIGMRANSGDRFILLKVPAGSAPGNPPTSGTIVHLRRSTYIHSYAFNGTVKITSLNGNFLIDSKVTNGYVEAFHPAITPPTTNASIVPGQGGPNFIELPEVIVTSSPSQHNTFNFSYWASVSLFLNNASTGGMTAGYFGFGGGGPGGSSSGGGATGSNGGVGSGSGNSSLVSITNQPIMQVDFENQYADPAIDLAKFLKCFANIPDAGANYSIELFTDIPVDADPTVIFDWSTGSPGHTFIQLKKVNDSQSVQQNIGFYPASGWKVGLSAASTPGKFVDNKGHEFNASIKVSVTSTQFGAALQRVLLLKDVRYDVDDYNCTDWAVSVFNAGVSVNRQLNVPRVLLPGGSGQGSLTPQGVYLLLKTLAVAGGAGASGVSVPLLGWVGNSTGACP